MASNATEVALKAAESEPDPMAELWVWVVYIIQGIFITATNVPVLAVFLKYRAFQIEKQYVFVAGLSLADALNGMAYFLSGVWRFVLSIEGTIHDKVTPVYCLIMPFNLMWLIANTTVPAMLFLVSIDRLVSVVFPLRYIKLSLAYANRLVGGLYGAALVYAMYAGYIAAGLSKDVDSYARPIRRVCYQSQITPAGTVLTGTRWYGDRQIFAAVTLFCSVVIYLVILAIGRRFYRKAIDRLGATVTDTKLKRCLREQHKMTVSVGISSMFTLFLMAVPTVVATYLVTLKPTASTDLVILIMFLTMNINPMLNIIIYMKRHPEVRKAMSALTTCKMLPDDLRLWTLPQTKPAVNVAPLA